MSYDINIALTSMGVVNFQVPTKILEGTPKLLQQVLILLFSDEGEMINFIGGKSNNQSLNEDVLINETARIIETINNTISVNVPDSERLAELEMEKISEDATYAAINVSVTAVSDETASIIINL